MQNLYDEEVISKILPRKLKDFRLKQGLTMEEVGQMLNKTRSAVSTWESGKATPDVKSLLKLCKIYKLTDFASFLDVDVPIDQLSLTKHEQKVLSLYRMSSRKIQKSIDNILEELKK